MLPSLKKFAATFVVLGIATTSHAQVPSSFTYLGLEASYYDIQKGKAERGDVKNFWQPAIHLGHRFNPLLSMQVQYGFAKTKMRYFKEDIKSHQFLLGGRVHWYSLKFGGFSPYLGAGYDYYQLRPKSYEKTQRDAVFGEIGVERMLGSHFMLDIGYRHIATIAHDKFVDRQPYVAINWVFGAPKKPEPVIQYEPEPIPKCIDVPKGAKLDDEGCPIMLTKEMRITLQMEFEFNSNVVDWRYYEAIGEVAQALREYPDSTLLLEGHTDNIGRASYNQELSKSRADAVMRVLVSDFEIDPSRIRTAGMGMLQPIADNNTEEGRAENRRVVAVISGTKEVIDYEDDEEFEESKDDEIELVEELTSTELDEQRESNDE